jgi:hypothetical protein
VTPNEIAEAELARLRRMLQHDQHPPERGAALWHQLGQFEDAMRKVLGAISDQDGGECEKCEALSAELEGVQAQLARATGHPDDCRRCQQPWDECFCVGGPRE